MLLFDRYDAFVGIIKEKSGSHYRVLVGNDTLHILCKACLPIDAKVIFGIVGFNITADDTIYYTEVESVYEKIA